MKNTLSLPVCLFVASFQMVHGGEQDTKTNSPSGKGNTASVESKPYSIESGIVRYTVTNSFLGLIVVGTEYFDQWGMHTAWWEKGEQTKDGVRKKIDLMNLRDGRKFYYFDLERKIGTLIENPILNVSFVESATTALGILESYEGYRSLRRRALEKGESEATADMLSFKKTGASEVAGKNCEVWERSAIGGGTFKYYVWHGVVVSSEHQGDGITQTMTAMQIEEGVSIPKEKLSPPPGIEARPPKLFGK